MNQFWRSLIWLAGGGPIPISKRLMAELLGARELRVREGPLEFMTLQIETNTPRRCPPFGVVRARLDAERRASSGSTRPAQQVKFSARSRAMLRLQPKKQAQHLLARREKRNAAPKIMRDVVDERANPLDSDWQRREIQRQLSDAEAAGLAEQARLEAAQHKQKERDAALVRLFDQEIDGDAGQVVRRDQVPKDAVFRQYPS